jgi:hypothetical protein
VPAVSEMFQVLILMAVPAVILFTIRCLIVRDNRSATQAGTRVTEPSARPSHYRGV